MSPRLVTTPLRANLALKRVVEALKPRATEYRVYDAKLPGFGLRVAPNGRKAFFIQYRYRGVKRRMYLGDARMVTPAQAHTLARVKLADVADGKDPLATKREAAVAEVAATRARRTSPTIADVAEKYLSSLAITGSPKWSKEARRLYEAHIAPKLGGMKITDASTSDVRDLHERLHKQPPTANRTRAVLSAILSRAIADGDRPTGSVNPCDGVPPYDEHARERYLSHEEWKRLGEAIVAERAALTNVPLHDTRPVQLDAILLLCLCGGRLEGVIRRRWDELDVEGRILRVTPPHKGTTRLYLGESALTLLCTWSVARGQRSPFIFPGQSRRSGLRVARGEHDVRAQRDMRPISWIRPVWESLCTRAKLVDIHPHDLRRSFAVVAGDVGISEHLIAGLLSHVVPGVTGVYAKRSDPALADAANKVSAEITMRLNLADAIDPKIISISMAKSMTP